MSETRSPGRSAVVLLRRAVEMTTFVLLNGPTGPVDEVRLYADDADGFPRSRKSRPGGMS